MGIDKNSFWGGLNIQKKQLCVKGILAQDLGFALGLFSTNSGDFRVRGGEGLNVEARAGKKSP
jgi:hypothetical protein